jgi:hypothetical protein
MPMLSSVPLPARILFALPLVLALLAWTLWWMAILPAAVMIVAYWLSAAGMLVTLFWFRMAPLLTVVLTLLTLAVLVPLATIMFAMTIWLIRGFAP